MYCFSKFCRLCVRTDKNLVNIFCLDNDLLMFSDKMRCLLPEIVYEEDSIPNLICRECCNNLKNMYEFKKMCLKNNEILKLYASKIVTIKESPENLENELKLLKEKIATDNSDFDYSLIFVKQKEVESLKNRNHNSTPNNNNSSKIKTELSAPELQIKSETEMSDNDLDNSEENKNKSKSTVIHENNREFNESALDLKLECTEEEYNCYSEDPQEEQGDESMDCDEVISVNDSENENGDDDFISIPEPMNLTAKVLNNSLVGNLDALNSSLPPYLASGNRVKTRTNDKYRMVYTEHQRLELEKEYLLNRFVPDRRRAELAMSLDLTVRQIKIWFQNRRAKERKEAKRTDTNSQDPIQIIPKIAPKPNLSTPERSQQRKPSSENSQSEELIRKQQEFYFQQQLLQQQQEILIKEQLLRQRKEFLAQQQQNLQKEFHQQLLPHQQEILRQEEYLRQQKQFFDQQQHLLQQRSSSVLTNQAMALLNQPVFLSNQTTVLPNLPQQSDLFSNLNELIKRKEEMAKTKELLPNLEELYRRKQELLKRNEGKNSKDKK